MHSLVGHDLRPKITIFSLFFVFPEELFHKPAAHALGIEKSGLDTALVVYDGLVGSHEESVEIVAGDVVAFAGIGQAEESPERVGQERVERIRSGEQFFNRIEDEKSLEGYEPDSHRKGFYPEIY